MLIGAGAGMGVDSGLPDFRGNEGFWQAYPPFARRGLSFVDMANPGWFESDPRLAWGFYGHRLHLYRDTAPHPGFDILRRWADRMAHGCFVYTSNVDGQFQRAGFVDDRVVECHGSIHHLQCSSPCSSRIWSANGINVEVDVTTFRARMPVPECPRCEATARPNILMFGDWGWHPERTAAQEQRLAAWSGLAGAGRVVVVELGAGTHVPTVRWKCEQAASRFDAPLVRINPREAHGPADTISLGMGAVEALEQINDGLG